MSSHDPALDRNVGRARAALEALVDAAQGSDLVVGELVPDPSKAAVYFDVSVGSDVVRMELSAPDPERRVFARSPSFDCLYQWDAGREQPPALRAALDRVRRALLAVDHGQFALEKPEGRSRGPNLLLVHSENERRQHRWSREKFERALEATPTGTRGVVAVISQPCEYQCSFCPSVDRDKARDDWMEKGDTGQLEDLLHQVRAAASRGAREIEFGANDALRFAPIVELVEAAASAGFETMIVQSTGLSLANRELCASLARIAGVEVHAPIYGTTAEEHQEVTRAPGGFERLCRALDNARELGGPLVRLHTIALANIMHRIEALEDFVGMRFGLPLCLVPLRANRVGERTHLGDTARLDEVRTLSLGRPSLPSGEFPLCVLHPSRSSAARGTRRDPRVNLFDLGMAGREHEAVVRDRSYAFSARCSRCALRAECTGVLWPYLDRYGDEELRPFAE